MRFLWVLVLSFQHLIWSPAHFSCFLGLEQFAIFLIIYSASRSPGFAPVHILACTGCVSLYRSLNLSVLTFSPGCDGVGQVISELCLFQITLGFVSEVAREGTVRGRASAKMTSSELLHISGLNASLAASWCSLYFAVSSKFIKP